MRSRFTPARLGPWWLRLLSLSVLLGAVSLVCALAAPQAAVSTQAAEAAAAKLERIRHPAPGQTTPAVTRFSEEEVNSYLHYDLAARFPPGLEEVNVRFTPSRLHGTAEVDFDKARASRRGGSPTVIPPMMDYLLRGRHTLSVEGSFSAIEGVGQFGLETVSLDGVEIPQPLVDFLINTYIRPRHPGLDLDRPFLLPYSIDRVQVERGSIEVEVQPSAASL